MAFRSKRLASLSERLSLVAVAGVSLLTLLAADQGIPGGSAQGTPPIRIAELAAAQAGVAGRAERSASVLSERAPDAAAVTSRGSIAGEFQTDRSAAELAPVTIAAKSRSSAATERGAAAKKGDKGKVVRPAYPVAPRAGIDVVSELLSGPAILPPEEWSDAQIIAALRECVRLLGPIAAEIEVAEPLKKGDCGTPAPVALRSIGSVDKVEFRPAVPLNCRMVAALHKWVEKSLQPAARELFASPIARINGSSYSCRNRYNNPLDIISQHAFANAIDIASFTTAEGRTIDVLRHWGPTARDLAAERAAAAKAKSAAPKKDQDKKLAALKAPEPSGPPGKVEASQMNLGAKQAAAAGGAKEAEPPAQPPAELQFLHRLHEGACAVFGTVLGPEANAAHRDHFHLDLAPRRRNNYCQ